MSARLVQETATDNGNSASFSPGAIGDIELFAVGTWDSGSAKLQQLAPDGVTWVDITAALTANGRAVGVVTHLGLCRVNLASVATASADLDFYVGGGQLTGVSRVDN